MGKETELKLLLAEDDHHLVLAAPSLAGYARIEQHLVNTYFDTVDHALHRARVALRIREKNGRYIQTLKTQGESMGGLSHRGEWEWDLNEWRLDIDKLQAVWPNTLGTIDSTALQPVFRTNFTRQMMNIVWEGAEIELGLDRGEILVGNKSTPISELELELKSGNESALHSLAGTLGTIVNLQPGDMSKAEQGYQLAGF